MKLPDPGTKDFNKLGPEARKLARWRSNSTPIKEKSDDKNLSSYIEV